MTRSRRRRARRSRTSAGISSAGRSAARSSGIGSTSSPRPKRTREPSSLQSNTGRPRVLREARTAPSPSPEYNAMVFTRGDVQINQSTDAVRPLRVAGLRLHLRGLCGGRQRRRSPARRHPAEALLAVPGRTPGCCRRASSTRCAASGRTTTSGSTRPGVEPQEKLFDDSVGADRAADAGLQLPEPVVGHATPTSTRRSGRGRSGTT